MFRRRFTHTLLAFAPSVAENSSYIFVDKYRCLRGSNIDSIISIIYPLIDSVTSSVDARYFAERAILAPTNAAVDKINEIATARFPGQPRVYLSADTTTSDTENNRTPTEFLNTLCPSGSYIYVNKGILCY